MIPVIAVLAVGTALMLAAQWRGWRPGLRTALTAGAVLASAAWQGAGYFYLAGLTSYTAWKTAHPWWALSSLAVIGCLLAAMPWSRRERQLTDAPVGTFSVDLAEEPSPAGSAGQGLLGGAVPALPGEWRSAKRT